VPSVTHHAPFAKTLAALGAALLVAACGLVAPNPTPTASPTHAPTAVPTPTVVPTPTIVPIPTPRLDVASAAPATAPHLDAATESALTAALDSIRSQANAPGMQAAIVFPDGSTWTGQSGVGVIATAAPVTADTLFSVASITKTFVAALVLRLAARGTLGLDDPLSRYVPSFPNAAAITLRELLSHTSGIHDLFTSPGMADDILADPSRAWTPQQVLARIGKPYFAPGNGYYYSNTNYVLLGLVVEKATGEKLATLVREEFLTPLGLSHTFMQTEERTLGVVAHGYNGSVAKPVDLSIGQTMVPFTSEVTACSSACAIVSNAADLARWASALYGGGLLDGAQMASMLDTTPALPYPSLVPRGLGAEVINLGGRVAWGHRGHLDGFDGSMMYLPESGLTIVVQANAEWANALGASATLANVVLGVPPIQSPSPSGATPSPSVRPS
jgi:D-alanyl-D-alanine carboxypeptidase